MDKNTQNSKNQRSLFQAGFDRGFARASSRRAQYELGDKTAMSMVKAAIFSAHGGKDELQDGVNKALHIELEHADLAPEQEFAPADETETETE